MSAHRRLFVVVAAVVAPAVFAAAPKPDIENGKNSFEQQCGICHSAEKDVEKGLAPNLVGVVGRKAGTHKLFPSYTGALKSSGITWNAKSLDEFLVNPTAKVPGTMMPIPVPDAQTRADIIAYLATLKN
jgi:cytochrome c